MKAKMEKVLPKILLMDENFIAVDKPSGIVVQGEDCEKSQSFFNAIKEEHGEFHRLHRLDKGTSGVLLLARTPDVAREFSKLLEAREVDKIYLALSDKKINKKQGWIKGSLQKSRRSSYKLVPGNENFSLSYFFNAHFDSIDRRIFLVRIYTGKTHQVRVHLKSQGAPILGDSIYGGGSYERLCLHNYKMKFRFSEKNYEILSDSFQSIQFLEALKAVDLELFLKEKPFPEEKNSKK